MLEKIHFFKEVRHSTRSLFWYFLLEGVLLLVLAVLVIVYPQIIILLFAFFFIVAGIIALWLAWKIGRLLKKIDDFLDLL